MYITWDIVSVAEGYRNTVETATTIIDSQTMRRTTWEIFAVWPLSISNRCM